MSEPSPKGISRQGLDEKFETDEVRKSQLILEAHALRDQKQDRAAAAKFAEAAEIEERLSEACEETGLAEKYLVHRFSAASCWAQAGNFYDAVALCEELLERSDLPGRLRNRVSNYADTIRQRRANWYDELVETADAE